MGGASDSRFPLRARSRGCEVGPLPAPPHSAGSLPEPLRPSPRSHILSEILKTKTPPSVRAAKDENARRGSCLGRNRKNPALKRDGAAELPGLSALSFPAGANASAPSAGVLPPPSPRASLVPNTQASAAGVSVPSRGGGSGRGARSGQSSPTCGLLVGPSSGLHGTLVGSEGWEATDHTVSPTVL